MVSDYALPITRIDLFYLGSRDEDDKLSSRVRKFYKRQDDIIDSFEQVHQHATKSDANDKTLNTKKRHIEWMIRATLVFNCVSLIKY
jgi:hypothetical protein